MRLRLNNPPVIPFGVSVFHRFLWLPVVLPVGGSDRVEVRWLEHANIEYEYGPFDHDGEGAAVTCWKKTRFID